MSSVMVYNFLNHYSTSGILLIRGSVKMSDSSSLVEENS